MRASPAEKDPSSQACVHDSQRAGQPSTDPANIVTKGKPNGQQSDQTLSFGPGQPDGVLCAAPGALTVPPPHSPRPQPPQDLLPPPPATGAASSPRHPWFPSMLFPPTPLRLCTCSVLCHGRRPPRDPSGEVLLQNSAQPSPSPERTCPLPPHSAACAPLTALPASLVVSFTPVWLPRGPGVS